MNRGTRKILAAGTVTAALLSMGAASLPAQTAIAAADGSCRQSGALPHEIDFLRASGTLTS